MCDSYIGLDQVVTLNFDKVNKRIKDNRKEPIAFDDCFENYGVLHLQADQHKSESDVSGDDSFEFDV
jgi:hypothetical protein